MRRLRFFAKAMTTGWLLGQSALGKLAPILTTLALCGIPIAIAHEAPHVWIGLLVFAGLCTLLFAEGAYRVQAEMADRLMVKADRIELQYRQVAARTVIFDIINFNTVAATDLLVNVGFPPGLGTVPSNWQMVDISDINGVRMQLYMHRIDRIDPQTKQTVIIEVAPHVSGVHHLFLSVSPPQKQLDAAIDFDPLLGVPGPGISTPRVSDFLSPEQIANLAQPVIAPPSEDDSD